MSKYVSKNKLSIEEDKYSAWLKLQEDKVRGLLYFKKARFINKKTGEVIIFPVKADSTKEEIRKIFRSRRNLCD
jgi:hypothetical protein